MVWDARSYRWTTAIAVALISTLVFAVPALANQRGGNAGGNSATSAACRNGGYANWTDADGKAFRNAGACVSYAAHGGSLVPVTSGPFSVVFSPLVGGFRTTITGTGLEPSSPVAFSFVWPAGSATATFNAEPNGDVTFVFNASCLDVDGNPLTSLTATGTPVGGVETTYILPHPPASICPPPA